MRLQSTGSHFILSYEKTVRLAKKYISYEMLISFRSDKYLASYASDTPRTAGEDIL
jgi:hypothetical protein